MAGGPIPPPGRTVIAYDRSLFWFRRDLRDTDNAGLYHALASSRQVWCVFVFDREILDPLPVRADRRVEFVRESLARCKDFFMCIFKPEPTYLGEVIPISGSASLSDDTEY